MIDTIPNARVERFMRDAREHISPSIYQGDNWNYCLIGQLRTWLADGAHVFDDVKRISDHYDLRERAVYAVYELAMEPGLRTNLEEALEMAEWVLSRYGVAEDSALPSATDIAEAWLDRGTVSA